MKSKVLVTLVARQTVEIEVEHEEDEDPADLTEDEEREAEDEGDAFPDWEVEKSEAVKP